MGGGPSTMDIWDLKSDSNTGGDFKPIATNGDVQICEHMPLMAQNMDKMSIVRSMSTREADHMRGRYYMHTGYVPNPNVKHQATAQSSPTSYLLREVTCKFHHSFLSAATAKDQAFWG